MPAAIAFPVRQAIFQRWQKGESVASLAQSLKLSVRTVRNLVRRFAQRGPDALHTDYARCATKALPTDQEEFQQAFAMRTEHPSWGGGLIRVLLREQGHEGCASERT